MANMKPQKRPRTRTKPVSFRFDPETAARLRKLAEADHSSQATYLIRLIHREYEKSKSG